MNNSPAGERKRDSKKPGWTHRHALPKFIIIGAQKSGTTFLYDLLTQHPDMLPALKKELHFFDFQYWKGFDWYRSLFPTKGKMLGTGLRHLRRPITGEASPSYLPHPNVPGRIATHLPNIRLIALLRNPVDRAYSHYHHEVAREEEMLSFEEAINMEEERIAGDIEKYEWDPRYASHNYIHFSYLTRGRYVEQLARYFSLFPRSNFFILRSEDLFDEPGQIFPQVTDFLGIRRWTPGSFPPATNKRYYPPMAPSTRQSLDAYFKPYNESLYQMLDRDFGW